MNNNTVIFTNVNFQTAHIYLEEFLKLMNRSLLFTAILRNFAFLTSSTCLPCLA